MIERIGHDDVPPEGRGREPKDDPGQLSLFDVELGRTLRDAAIKQADEAANRGWKDAARESIASVARRREKFTTDAVWAVLSRYHPEESTHEKRALAALMREARKQGIIEPTNEWRQSADPTCHARPKRVWRSLVI